MMKVLLLNPPKFKENIFIDPVLVRCTGVPSKAPYLWPPIGLAYIAGFVESICEVKILDAQAENLGIQDIIEKCKNFNMIVFNLGTISSERDLSLCSKIKEVSPQVKVVLIGTFATYFHSELIKNTFVDFVIRGEAEKPLFNLIRNIENPNLVGSLTWRSNGKVVVNDEEPFLENLDSCPFAARHLLPNEKYYDILTDKNPITFMITSRGCPFDCNFCTNRKIYGKKYRYRSVGNVVGEIKKIIEEGFKDITFFDDTFTINKERVLKLSERIKNFDISWRALSRVDTINKKMLEEMYKSGCYQIHFGVESGDQRILNAMNKGISIEQTKKVFKWCDEVGIETVAFFILGHPKETKKSIRKTFRLLNEIKPDFATFNLLTPLPGSEIYETLKPQETWENLDFLSTSFCDIPSEEMKEKIGEMYKKYYLRIGYITNRLKKAKRLSDIRRVLLQNIKFWMMREGVFWRFIAR